MKEQYQMVLKICGVKNISVIFFFMDLEMIIE